MNFIKRYLIPRLIQYFWVILLGITIVFFLPRLLPNDPVMRTITALQARGATLDPESIDAMVTQLRDGLWPGRLAGRAVRGVLVAIPPRGFRRFLLPVSHTGNQAHRHRHALDCGSAADHDGHLLDTRESHRRVGGLLHPQAMVADPGYRGDGHPPAALLHLCLRAPSSVCLRGEVVPGYRRRVDRAAAHLHLGLHQRRPLAFVSACPLAHHPRRGRQVPDDEADRAERQCGRFRPVCQAGRRQRTAS